MASFRAFLYVYILGGLTFVPLIIGLVLLFAYYTLPQPSNDRESRTGDPAHLVRDGDDKTLLKTATDDLAEKFHRKHESDVAAGYFAVCREYVPGGVNGKPPDKLTPAGEVVSTESPSVYQTMYRSIFDRTHKPTIEPNKDGVGKVVKRANNVFYVVLRHGHLMLYDDIQQLEVRYVISLEYHDVDIYGGGEEIPEAELYIKRNAIRLRRKNITVGDKSSSLPFFLFGENLSEKEDFYLAILQNMQKSAGDIAPVPQEFDVAHIITLVQRLHSSEEQLQTRWLNALIGRYFLAMYKTPELEDLIRLKLTKKIARVKKPNFITKLALQKIDPGKGAPFFTNLRLKDLTVNGDCTVEADVSYSGSFRIEIAATVRIDLGTRLKAREVDMVLAATCKKLDGHALLKFKPPPSNRVWVSFEKPPKMELALEPIVSSRQITYGVILRTIESRIMEVIAETIVLPFWDDIPFTDTSKERFRGGIWKKESKAIPNTVIKDEIIEDEAEAGSDGTKTPDLITKDDRVLSMPVLSAARSSAAAAAARKSVTSLKEITDPERPKTPEKTLTRDAPRALRSSSFAVSGADPMVSPSHAPAHSPLIGSDAAQKRDNVLKDISLRSVGASSESEIEHLQPDVTTFHQTPHSRTPSIASKASTENDLQNSDNASLESHSTLQSSLRSAPTDDGVDSKRSSLHEDLKQKGLVAATKSMNAADRQKALASITAATTAAQKWGWGVLARNKQREADAKAAAEQEKKHDTPQPMGRGQPLPPPGVPLPRPTKPSIFSLPQRKAATSNASQKTQHEAENGNEIAQESPPKPALPERRRRQSALHNSEDHEDELLVVEAPSESAPTSPSNMAEEHQDEFFGHGEENTDSKDRNDEELPPLPSRPPYVDFDSMLGKQTNTEDEDG